MSAQTGTGPFGDVLLDDNQKGGVLPTSAGRSGMPDRQAPTPNQKQQTYDTAYQSVGMVKGECGREYRTVDPTRGPCEPEPTIACCPANLPSNDDWAEFRELMLKKCKQETLTECDVKKLRELRYKFGTMAWGFTPSGYAYEAGRVLNRAQLKDNSVFFGKEVFGSFFFFMIFVWTTAGFGANPPVAPSVIDGPNVGLQQAFSDLLAYQYSRDLLSTHYWAYVGAIFATTMLTHLLFQTAFIEGALTIMLWWFSDDGMVGPNKPRWSPLFSMLAGEAIGFALAGCLTLAIRHEEEAFDSLKFEPSPAYGNGVDFLFENTGCFIIAMGWIASLIMPRTLIKQFHSFQVVVPVLITIFHAVAKAITIHTTVGPLGIWTYLFVSLFCTGFGSSIWVYIVSPLSSVLMAAVVWYMATRYIYSFGGNKWGKVVFRLNF